MRNIQESILAMLRQHSVRKRITVVLCLVAIATVFTVLWVLRISGITLTGENSTDGEEVHTYTDAGYDGVATVTDADGEDWSLTSGAATASYTAVTASDEESDSGIATASEDSGSAAAVTATNASSADFYLATTVDEGNFSSGDDYIIYTVIDSVYYVLTSDESLVACTTVSSAGDATGDGPYYIESTGTILYGTSSTVYTGSVWTMTQSGSNSASYYAENTDSGEYLAATGSGSDGDVTITTGFSAHTGELTFYGDFELTYTFTNTCNGSDNWENFIVEMTANGVYLDVRSDNYGWLAPENGYDTSDTLTFGDGSDDWDAWLSAMKSGEDVTVVITRIGSDVVVTTTANGETFTATAYVSEYADDAALTVYLTGENCTINDLAYTATVDTVQLAGGQAALTCGATGASLAGTPLSVVAAISSNALTWTANASAAEVFYFAEVQDTADNYHFADTVTLTDAAKNQDESYIVYTKIDGVYYIVSAVDGSLLACTDVSSYSNEDDKVLLSAAAGVYVWDYDDTTGEPEFKFTTGTGDDGEDNFEDYRWTVSSEDYNAASGTGIYTLNNESNEDYLAPELDVTADTLVRGTNVNSSDTILYDCGKVEYTITVDASYQSGGVGYTCFRTYIYHTGTYTTRYLCVAIPNGAVGTKWSGSDISLSNSGYGDAVGYGMGTMSLSVGDVLRLTITTAEDSIVLIYHNQTTDETCVYYIDLSSIGSAYLFDTGARIYINTINGNYTVSPVTATYDSSTYGISNSITANSDRGSGSYSMSGFSEVGVSGNSHATLNKLSGDFDVTYAFTEKSDSTSDLNCNFTVELNNGASSAVYIDVSFYTQWTWNAATGTFETGNSYDDDTTGLLAALAAGADCEVRVIRTGNYFLFVLSATYSGTTYTRFVSVTVDDFEDCDVNIYLMGNYCTISDLTYTNNTVGAYNETSYNRVADSAKTITVTAADSTGGSVQTESYLWTAEAAGYYSEDFSLIAQLSADGADTAEIEWVEDTASGAEATGTATLTLANVQATTLSDTVVVTFSLARVSEAFVWFDGTSGGMDSYSANTNVTAYDEVMTIPYDAYGSLETITTPTSITDASGYGSTIYGGYTLRGWYDIYNGDYYLPGEEVTLSGNTVMYADWEVTSYDIGQNANLAGSISTDTFITTRLFDYNELFDAQSTLLVDSADRSTTSSGTTYTTTDYRTLTLSGHRELFGLSSSSSIALGSSSLGFLFFRTESYGFYYSALGYTVNGNDPLIDYPEGRGGTINASASGTTQEILGGYGTNASDVSLLNTLFDTDNTVDDVDEPLTEEFVLGKTYVGTADYLFQYDSDSGYYYYNSEKNAASYNATEKRFYVYDYIVKANTGGSSASTDDFLPFNYDTAGASISMNNINYWFGMSTEIEYYLPDDVPAEGSEDSGKVNLALDETHHMTFKFSGDDDVWVFIDGVLVLDLGGVHGQVYGEIDFSTGEVVVVNTAEATVSGETVKYVDYDTRDIIDYTDAATSAGLVVEQTEAETYVRQLKSGSHTLTFYYLERGASQSNAAIYFNISSTTYNLDLSKLDEDGGASLEGAEFTFYTDSNFTEEALLATSQGGENDTSTFTAPTTVYRLREGVTYYVLETKAPDGYTAEGKYFTVCMNDNELIIAVYDSTETMQELYEYTIVCDTSSGACTVTRTNTSSVTNSSSWNYIVVDESSEYVTAGVEIGSVAYYTIKFSIANTKVYELPATGGMGIQTYLRTGEALVLLAGVGMIMIAFYHLVRARRCRAREHNRERTKEKMRRKSCSAGARDRPQERGDPHGNARNRP